MTTVSDDDEIGCDLVGDGQELVARVSGADDHLPFAGVAVEVFGRWALTSASSSSSASSNWIEAAGLNPIPAGAWRTWTMVSLAPCCAPMVAARSRANKDSGESSTPTTMLVGKGGLVGVELVIVVLCGDAMLSSRTRNDTVS